LLLRWGLPLACVLGMSGCDLNGLVDIGDSLLDPDAALLDHPGRQLIKGHYSGLKIAGSSENGGYVLARRDGADPPAVALVPFLTGDHCEYSPAFGYDRFSSRVDIELPGTISVQVDQNDQNSAYGTVRFIDYACNEVIGEIPDTALPGPLFPGIEPFGMLSRSTDGTLYLVDVKEQKRKLVAPLVDYGVVAGSLLFTLESGEIVIRDEDLKEVGRTGSGVQALVATGGPRLPLAYVDETGMHVWNEKSGESPLSEDACSPWYIGLDAVAYYDPCDSGRLAIHAPKDFIFGAADVDGLVTLRGPEKTVLSSLTMMPGVAKAPASLSEITLVMAQAAGTRNGDLLVLTVPDDAATDDDDVQLEAVSLAKNVTYAPEHGVYYKNYDDERGTLLDFERDDDGRVSGVVELLEDVASVPYASPYSYLGVLGSYDGEAGNLVRLTRKKDGTVARDLIGENVPLQKFVGDYKTEMVAYVSEIDEDGLGILTIVDELGPFQVAENVFIDEIDSLDDPQGVVFTSPSKVSGAFELHAWLIEAELDLLIHDAASEYFAIPWPSPGVLYAVPEGDDAGLWFAKAR
jgi:hypothetical protein